MERLYSYLAALKHNLLQLNSIKCSVVLFVADDKTTTHSAVSYLEQSKAVEQDDTTEEINEPVLHHLLINEHQLTPALCALFCSL